MGKEVMKRKIENFQYILAVELRAHCGACMLTMM